MPYCYVEDMSIVAWLCTCVCVCVCACHVSESVIAELTRCIVFTGTIQCTSGILEHDDVATYVF